MKDKTDEELIRIWRAGELARDELRARDDARDRAWRQKRTDEIMLGARYFLSHHSTIAGAWVIAVDKTTDRAGCAAVEVTILELVGSPLPSTYVAGRSFPVYAGNLYAKIEDVGR